MAVHDLWLKRHAPREILLASSALVALSMPVVGGPAPTPDAALVTASAERKWLNGFSLVATFEGEFSQATRSYAGKGLVRYLW